MIIPQDIAVLTRFVLHGVKTTQGERMDISTEVLRKSSTHPVMQHNRNLENLRDVLLVPLTPGLTPSSLKTYQQELLAYLRYAGSVEQAFQPETLRRWIAHLSNPPDHSGRAPRLHTINRKVTPVRRAMAEAGRSGQLDQARASAFASIRVRPEKKRGPKPRIEAEST